MHLLLQVRWLRNIGFFTNDASCGNLRHLTTSTAVAQIVAYSEIDVGYSGQDKHTTMIDIMFKIYPWHSCYRIFC